MALSRLRATELEARMRPHIFSIVAVTALAWGLSLGVVFRFGS